MEAGKTLDKEKKVVCNSAEFIPGSGKSGQNGTYGITATLTGIGGH